MGLPNWKYYLMRLANTLIAPLPSPVGYRVANFFGDCGYFFGRKSRSNLEQNLKHVVGGDVEQRALRRLTREAFRNLSRNYFDLLRVPKLSPEKTYRRVEFEGLEYVEQARAGGRGVIAATAHLGSWDLIGQVTLAMSIPLTILVERLQSERLWDYWMKLRAHQGMAFHPAGPQGVRAAYRALKRNELVGIACDRSVQGNTVTTTFMGESAVMPTGAAELALRTGAAVMPIFSTRTGRDRYRIAIEPPIFVGSNGGGHTREDVRLLVDEIISAMEPHIRRNPEQWMLFHPLWRGGNGG